jgi:hypothetical protein
MPYLILADGYGAVWSLLIKADYWAISASEKSFARFGASVDLDHVGVLTRLQRFARPFDGINKLVNIMRFATNQPNN